MAHEIIVAEPLTSRSLVIDRLGGSSSSSSSSSSSKTSCSTVWGYRPWSWHLKNPALPSHLVPLGLYDGLRRRCNFLTLIFNYQTQLDITWKEEWPRLHALIRKCRPSTISFVAMNCGTDHHQAVEFPLDIRGQWIQSCPSIRSIVLQSAFIMPLQFDRIRRVHFSAVHNFLEREDQLRDNGDVEFHLSRFTFDRLYIPCLRHLQLCNVNLEDPDFLTTFVTWLPRQRGLEFVEICGETGNGPQQLASHADHVFRALSGLPHLIGVALTSMINTLQDMLAFLQHAPCLQIVKLHHYYSFSGACDPIHWFLHQSKIDEYEVMTGLRQVVRAVALSHTITDLEFRVDDFVCEEEMTVARAVDTDAADQWVISELCRRGEHNGHMLLQPRRESKSAFISSSASSLSSASWSLSRVNTSNKTVASLNLDPLLARDSMRSIIIDCVNCEMEPRWLRTFEGSSAGLSSFYHHSSIEHLHVLVQPYKGANWDWFDTLRHPGPEKRQHLLAWKKLAFWIAWTRVIQQDPFTAHMCCKWAWTMIRPLCESVRFPGAVESDPYCLPERKSAKPVAVADKTKISSLVPRRKRRLEID